MRVMVHKTLNIPLNLLIVFPKVTSNIHHVCLKLKKEQFCYHYIVILNWYICFHFSYKNLRALMNPFKSDLFIDKALISLQAYSAIAISPALTGNMQNYLQVTVDERLKHMLFSCRCVPSLGPILVFLEIEVFLREQSAQQPSLMRHLISPADSLLVSIV